MTTYEQHRDPAQRMFRVFEHGVFMGIVVQGVQGRWRRINDPVPTWFATRDEAAQALVRMALARTYEVPS